MRILTALVLRYRRRQTAFHFSPRSEHLPGCSSSPRDFRASSAPQRGVSVTFRSRSSGPRLRRQAPHLTRATGISSPPTVALRRRGSRRSASEDRTQIGRCRRLRRQTSARTRQLGDAVVAIAHLQPGCARLPSAASSEANRLCSRVAEAGLAPSSARRPQAERTNRPGTFDCFTGSARAAPSVACINAATSPALAAANFPNARRVIRGMMIFDCTACTRSHRPIQ